MPFHKPAVGQGSMDAALIKCTKTDSCCTNTNSFLNVRRELETWKVKHTFKFDFCPFTIHHCYSVLKLFTGLDMAALMD